MRISEALLMDNMEYMAKFPDKFFDLAVVDPEYGINVNHNMGRRKGQKSSKHKKVTWDNKIPSKEYFNELFRVSQNQIIWGGNYFTEYLKPSPCWLLWDKGFSDEVTFATFEMAWTSFKTTAKKFDKHPSQQGKIHPTQKPISIYDWIYKIYLPEGGKVIDTHLGSCSNRIAADKAGNIDFYSCELDKEYFQSQELRFKQYKSQLKLF